VKLILVTGASGFVGAAVCRELELRGNSVLKAVRRHVKPDDGAIGVGNIDSKTEWTEALNRVDVVIHLAARVHVMQDRQTDPLAAFRTVNVDGTAHLALCASKAGVRRFIYLSSVKVNGEESIVPYNEEMAVNPSDPYGQSKWEAEQVLRKIADETGLDVVILRPPLVYGPGVKANFLKLLRLVKRGLPLPLGAVHNKRSMIYLENITDAITVCADYPKAANRTFLISDGQDISTPTLIRMLAKKMGKKSHLLPLPVPLLKTLGRFSGRSGEIERLVGSLQIDSRQIRSTIDWHPPFPVEEGLLQTVNWFMHSENKK
jgi:nucleoside-diphosphate-sugar epimerase